MSSLNQCKFDFQKFSAPALSHLENLIRNNKKVMEKISSEIVDKIPQGYSLFIFGSGHSALMPLELYHRAGGASFVIPVVADFMMPIAGPNVVRVLERTPAIAIPVLDRFGPFLEGEMIWIVSQSGINGVGIEIALEAKKRKLKTVAFTSLIHSKAVSSRHVSGKKLYEVCDEVVDLGGFVGDASVKVGEFKAGIEDLRAGPLSGLGTVFLGHAILTSVVSALESSGYSCTYTSVNTPEGEKLNRHLEERAKKRDFLLK